MDDKQIKLNPQQKEAVKHNKGPLLIIAGAGTGKTTVITEKIKHIIQNKLAKPEEILALTFTDKASFEMEERVDKAVPYGYFQMWISTFHSFADQILREEIHHIGLDPNYKIFSDAEMTLFIKKNLYKFDLKYFRPLGNPTKFITALIKHFSRLKDENISPEEYIKWSTTKQPKTLKKEDLEKNIELSHAYKKYQELKLEKSIFDFSDLIFYLILLFKKRKNVLKTYQKKFKYVLVDEFQDTNIAQYDLLKIMFPPKTQPNITVVGDDSQAIYKFRGASISNILNFMHDFKNSKQITLNLNYRSNQNILDHSYRLIQNNNPYTLESKLGISKKLISQYKRDKKNSVSIFMGNNLEEEVEFVTSKIEDLVEKGDSFSDMALLVRANKHAQPFIQSLIRKGIPFQFLGPGALFKRQEVKNLVSYLKFISNPNDSVSLFTVLSSEIINIDNKDLLLLISFARLINKPLLTAIDIYLNLTNTEKEPISKYQEEELVSFKKYLPLLTLQSRSSLPIITKMINKHINLINKKTAGQILYYFLEDTGYIKKIANYKTEEDELKTMNISKFFSKLKELEENNEIASVNDVVEFIDTSMELGESPAVSKNDLPDINAVNILTVHSAKGLEFKNVFLVNLVQGRFPTRNRREVIPIPNELIKEVLPPSSDYHLQEERRLFYVGMTRAKNNLFLSASSHYGSNKRRSRISIFVQDTIGKNKLEKYLEQNKEKKEQLSIFDFQPPKPSRIAYKQKRLKIQQLSFSQIDSYQICPQRYKYQYIYRIPTEPTESTSFGSTIHKVLQKFYYDFKKDNNLDQQYLLSLLKKLWIPIGYSSQKHEQVAKQEAKNILKKFYLSFHNKNIKILGLEQGFKLKINNDIFINGKIDRVDLISNKEIEIIDYKTGKMPDEKRLRKSMQLSIYALAAKSRYLYNRSLNDIILTFIYLKENKKVSFKLTQKDLDDTKENIINIVENIREQNFMPKPSLMCKFCPFKMMCDAW